MGYFEGIDSERGIAYRVSDSLSLREFLGLSLEEPTPDHSTLSKTRRMMNLGTHQAVFRWVLKRLAAEGLLSGKNLGGGRDHAGSQRGAEIDRAAGRWGQLR
jgi:transposase